MDAPLRREGKSARAPLRLGERGSSCDACRGRGLTIDDERLDPLVIAHDDDAVGGAGAVDGDKALDDVAQDGLRVTSPGNAVAAPARGEGDDALSGLDCLFTDDVRQVAGDATAVDQLSGGSAGGGRLPGRLWGR